MYTGADISNTLHYLMHKSYSCIFLA